MERRRAKIGGGRNTVGPSPPPPHHHHQEGYGPLPEGFEYVEYNDVSEAKIRIGGGYN